MSATATAKLHDATAHYTTTDVVDRLLDLIGWPDKGALLDPGAGDGSFLLRAVERLDLRADDLSGLVDRVQAWEIHPPAADMARERLASYLVEQGWRLRDAKLVSTRVIRTADFLFPGPAEGRRFRFIVGNPPYLRYTRLPEHFQRLYAAREPDYARQDIMHMFLNRAADLLQIDGKLGFVTADRWLFNESAGRLRAKIGETFGLEHVERLDPTTSFYRAKTRRLGAPPRVHPVAVVLSRSDLAPIKLSKTPYYPDQHTLDLTNTVPLGSVATIRLAPWLGPEGVFYMDFPEALERKIPLSHLVWCVDTDDIKGTELQHPRRVAIRSLGTKNRSILNHLYETRDKLTERARYDDPTKPPESWGVLPYQAECLLIPRIARSIKCVRLPAGVLPINHNLTVVSSSDASLDDLERALSTPEVQQWVDVHAPRLEGGFYSITTKLLRQLPIRL